MNRPFLRVPPFPGARPATARSGSAPAADAAAVADLAARLVAARVGGSFWGPRPDLPVGAIVLAAATRAGAAAMTAQAHERGIADRAIGVGPEGWFAGLRCVPGDSDPWPLAERADAVWVDGAHDLALVAGLLGRPRRVFAPGRFGGSAAEGVAALLADDGWCDPFDGRPWTPAQVVAQFTDWRALIDANRPAARVFGIARWKRPTLDALLWGGAGPVAYAARADALRPGERALAWVTRTAPAVLAALPEVGEIEDGMIRSQGLGANCVPPLSVVVDAQGVHFDPSRPNGLERLLAEGEFDAALLARAAALRERLVATGIGKYGADGAAGLPRATSGRRRVLVPGQVEDDRSILTGGAGLTNLALLKAARALEPGAHIVFRPHPDVEAGHRAGRVADADALAYADAVERGGSVAAAIAAADALHVITSLAGFEALMRGKAVTTHGVPFYAGWGLTRDLGPVPDRRGRARSIDELVAAVLILYPRYLDPLSRLPCPVEVLVERLAAGDADIRTPLVRLREWQGRVVRAIGLR